MGRTVGITPRRLIAGGPRGAHRVVNHAARSASLPVDPRSGRGLRRHLRGPRPPAREARVHALDRPRPTSRIDVRLRRPRRRPARRPMSCSPNHRSPIEAERSDGSGADRRSGRSVRLRWAVALDARRIAGIALDGLGRARRRCADDDRPRSRPPEPAPPERRTRGPRPYHAWERGTTAIVRDGELLDLAIRRSHRRPAAAAERRPDAGEHYVAAGVPWFTTLFGRDSIITSLQVLPFMPAVARETLRVLADWQATEDDPERDMEPGKILHELRVGELARTGRAAAPAVLRLDRLDAAVADPARRDVSLDGRPRPRPIAVAERARRARVDRHATATATATASSSTSAGPPAGLLNQGWKDSGDAIRHRDGTLGGAADRARRDPGLRLRRQAPDGLPRRAAAARPTLAERLDARGRRARSRASTRRSGCRTCASTRSRSTATSARSDRSARTRALPVERDRPAGAGRRGRRPAAGPVDGLRLGHPDVRLRPAGLQPGRLPHGHGLAARQRPHRGGHEARRPARRRRSRRVADLRGGPALAGLPAAGAVLRLRPRASRTCRSPTPSRARRRRGRRRRRSRSSRRCSGCTPTRPQRHPRARSAAPARVARQGHRARAARRRADGGPAVPPLARNTTSAEVLRRDGPWT